MLAYGIPILAGNELQDEMPSVSDLATIHTLSEQLDLSILFVGKSKKGKSLSVLWKDAKQILNDAAEQILKETWEAMQCRRECKTMCSCFKSFADMDIKDKGSETKAALATVIS